MSERFRKATTTTSPETRRCDLRDDLGRTEGPCLIETLATAMSDIFIEALNGFAGQQHLAGCSSRHCHRSIHSTNEPALSVTIITRSTRSL